MIGAIRKNAVNIHENSKNVPFLGKRTISRLFPIVDCTRMERIRTRGNKFHFCTITTIASFRNKQLSCVVGQMLTGAGHIF